MIEKFCDWFLNDCIDEVFYGIGMAVRSAMELGWLLLKVVCALILLPIWILPFIYWYFTEHKQKEEAEQIKGE